MFLKDIYDFHKNFTYHFLEVSRFHILPRYYQRSCIRTNVSQGVAEKQRFIKIKGLDGWNTGYKKPSVVLIICLTLAKSFSVIFTYKWMG
jgi:hypothetical protein